MGYGQEKQLDADAGFQRRNQQGLMSFPSRALCVNGQRGKNYPQHQHQTYHSFSQTYFPLLRPLSLASTSSSIPNLETNSISILGTVSVQPTPRGATPSPLSNLPALLVTGSGCDSAREVSDRLPRHTTRPRPKSFSPLPEPRRQATGWSTRNSESGSSCQQIDHIDLGGRPLC